MSKTTNIYHRSLSIREWLVKYINHNYLQIAFIQFIFLHHLYFSCGLWWFTFLRSLPVEWAKLTADHLFDILWFICRYKWKSWSSEYAGHHDYHNIVQFRFVMLIKRWVLRETRRIKLKLMSVFWYNLIKRLRLFHLYTYLHV